MGWGHTIHALKGQRRSETFADSPQLTLGQLIESIAAIPPNWEKASKGDTKDVRFDFGYFFPTRLSSWRGSYDELAIEYMDGDEARELYAARQKNKVKNHKLIKEPSVTEFLAMLNDAVGKEFTGYKGGEFTMGLNTPIWVANSGDGNNTAVVGVIDEGYGVIVETRWCGF